MAQECHPVAIRSHVNTCVEHRIPHTAAFSFHIQVHHPVLFKHCTPKAWLRNPKTLLSADTKLQAFHFHPGCCSPNAPKLPEMQRIFNRDFICTAAISKYNTIPSQEVSACRETTVEINLATLNINCT